LEESKQAELAKKIFWSVIAVSSIFGINTIIFSIVRNIAQASASKIETKEALAFSIEQDRPLFTNNWQREMQSCNNVMSEKNIGLITDLMILRNRTEDYISVLEDSLNFRASETQVTSLINLRQQIDSIFKDDFGMSLEAAKSIGIRDADSYAKKVSQLKRSNMLCSNVISVKRSSKISFEKLKSTVSSLPADRIDFTKIESQSTLLFYLLISTEILVFLLISSIDLWNTSINEMRRRAK